MATQSAAVHGAHARHGSAGSATMTYPPLPGSPTLTNPDMILPDYEQADSPEDRAESPLSMWKNTQPSDLDFHLPRQNTYAPPPANPTTPIIYGNGTMLSDIGEVTEAESTVGPASRRTSSRYSVRSDDDTALQPPAQIIAGVVKRGSQIKMRQRRPSTDSTSTVTTQDQKGHIVDFDEAASVDDSNFQGDDEESMASSYVDDGYAHGQTAVAQHRLQGGNGYANNSISQRAEHILANAKRRLTGNLSRARTSLNYASMSDGSTPSPPLVRPATSLRESTLPLSPSHSRNGSDNSMRGTARPALHSQRSASALGAAGGYRQPSSSRSGSDAVKGTAGRTHGISHHALDTTLQPLSEDEDDNMSLSDNRLSNSSRPSGMVSPALSQSEGGLSRSASVAQMRDIQDQMSGLKGKISTLKEQARADSMKRRSLQSLRTPSPFTHARWDHGYMGPRGTKTPDIPDNTGHGAPPAGDVPRADAGGQGVPTEEIEVAPLDGHNEEPGLTTSAGAGEDADPRGSPRSVERAPSEDINPREEGIDRDADEMRTEDGDASDEEAYPSQEYDDDYGSESGESTYHDSYQDPLSHEDREDAFDYERFFLHSAMGTLGGRRGSDSEGSEDSVETTRGPASANPRRSSLDTMSSVESFATATEGMNSRSSTSHGGRAKKTETRTREEEHNEPLEEERSSPESGVEDAQSRPRQNSVLHRPFNSVSASNLHRPSVSSFDSTGTNRSFPLVNKARLNGGVLTPGGSPDLKQISETLMDETASASTRDGLSGGAAMEMLSEGDRLLVEGLVASLGKCVLGLGQAAHAGADAQAYREKMAAARRILESSVESSDEA